MYSSAALLILHDTNGPAIGRIATYFMPFTRPALLQLSCHSSVLFSAPESLCIFASRFDRGLYSEMRSIGQDEMRRMPLSIGNIPLTSMSMNDAIPGKVY